MSVLDNIIKMRNDIKQVYDKAIDVKRGSKTSLQVMDKSISQLKDLFFKFVSITDYGRTCDKNLDNYIELTIHDNGMGIPENIIDKIFNPFFTTKPTRKGNTGMGLSLSYDIVVQQHRGQLDVESQEEQFAKFVVRLPKELNDA